MAVLEELGSKLTDIAGIKVSFPLQNDKDLILKIYARLCLLYDETWNFGDASFSLSCKKILRLLNRVGIAHLTPTAADVVDPRRLPRVWSAFIAHLEQKYGSQGLYPRLRKVLKQQQILAARGEAERERQQRMAVSAPSPSKPRLGDISTGSALSQDSQEDVRFAKPHPPLPKVRHASASSSGSTVSPSKAGPRSRIPVPTKPNLIPTGKQLARTPSLYVKKATPAAGGPAVKTNMIQVFGSPRLTAPKPSSPPLVVSKPAAAAPAAAAQSASATDTSPERRCSLIPAAKSPEQALGEYIESRLNAGFPQEDNVPRAAEVVATEVTATVTSPTPPAPAAATEAALNVTYSAERPAAAPRPVEQAPSPAADAREAILQAAEDAADKENVRPAEAEPAVTGKPAGKVEDSVMAAAARGVRRDTYEVTPAPENPEQPASRDEDEPSSAQTEPPKKRGARAKKVKASAQDPLPVAEAAPAPEISAETAQVSSANAQETKAPKKRGGRAKGAKKAASGDAPSSDEVIPAPEGDAAAQAVTVTAVDTADQTNVSDSASAEAQPVQTAAPAEEAPKKRRGRAKKEAKTTDETAASAQIVPPATSSDAVQPAAVGSAADEGSQEPAEIAVKEAPKKHRGRAKKNENKVAELAENVPSKSDLGDAPVTEPSAIQTESGDLDATEPAKTTKQAAPKKRRGKAKEAKPAAVVVDPVPAEAESAPAVPESAPALAESAPAAPESVPVVPELCMEHNSELNEQAVKPARASRRKTAARPQKSQDSESAPDVPESAPESVPAAPESVPAAPESVPVVPESCTEQPAAELTEQAAKPARASRRKTAAQPQKSQDSESAPDVPESTPESAPESVTEEPAVELNEQAVKPARAGRRKTAARPQKSINSDSAPDVPESSAVTDSVSAAPQSVPAVPESCTEQPSAELTEQAAKPARASRRKPAARPQKSTDSETADDADPTWVPLADEPVAGVRRGRRAARQKSQPAVSPDESTPSELDPAAVRGRHAELSEQSAEPSVQTAEPSVLTAEPSVLTAEPSSGRAGSRASRAAAADPASDPDTAAADTTAASRRSTRGGRKAPDQDGAEEPAVEAPPCRRRRLRVVRESDSEEDAPPAPAADSSPSPAPAPAQRSRRERKAAKETGPARRALRALDNCN